METKNIHQVLKANKYRLIDTDSMGLEVDRWTYQRSKEIVLLETVNQ